MAQPGTHHAPADPAPALGRGITLLHTLDREGACSLEQLARVTGWPKSSVARLLRSLVLAGVVRRDASTRRFHAVCRLVSIDARDDRLRAAAERVMAELAATSGQTIELHTFDPARPDEPLTMIDRYEPEDAAVRVHARIGFQRNLDEIDAITQVAVAFGGLPVPPAASPWAWQDGRHIELTRDRLAEMFGQCRERGAAVDVDTNSNGVFRYAAPVVNHQNRLVAVLAIAQFVTPISHAGLPAHTDAVRAAAERMTREISSPSTPDLHPQENT